MRLGELDRVERRFVAAAAAGALGIVALIVLVGGAPIAWVLLAICAVVCIGVLVPAIAEGRVFEPLPVLMVAAFFSFVVRPFQLFLAPLDLLSWHNPQSSLNGLLSLDTQELALFITQRTASPLEPLLTRTTAACALFLAGVLCGYLLPWGRALATRLSRIGREPAVDLSKLIGTCLTLGLLGQLAILIKVGGPAEAANQIADQTALGAGVPLHFLAGFGTAGIVIWAAWRVPEDPRERLLLGLVTLEWCAFYALAGSRTRVLLLLLILAVIVHYRGRPWRMRELAVAALAVLVLSAALLGVRQASADRPFGEAIGSAPKYIIDPRGVMNDATEYDGLLMATTIYGQSRSYRYGMGLVDAFYSYVPGRIAPNKPESADITFRKLVWGKVLKGGRPYTLVGDFYVDFGFPGVAVGALLFGVLMRALLGLLWRPREDGGAFRVALYAVSLAIAYTALVTTYSVALGLILTLAGPFLLAVFASSWHARRRTVALASGSRPG